MILKTTKRTSSLKEDIRLLKIKKDRANDLLESHVNNSGSIERTIELSRDISSINFSIKSKEDRLKKMQGQKSSYLGLEEVVVPVSVKK